MATVLTSRQIGSIVAIVGFIVVFVVCVVGGTLGGWFNSNEEGVSDLNVPNLVPSREPSPDLTYKEFRENGEELTIFQDLETPNNLENMVEDGNHPALFFPSHLKGEKGDRGPRGPPGMTVRGPPGPSGSPGISERTPNSFGVNSCDCNESLLRQYVKDTNPKLIPGPPGPPGASGQLKIGSEGPTGPLGPKGHPGDTGKPGPEGLIGHKGEPGREGSPGLPGPPGPPGPHMMYTPSFKYGEMNWGKKNVFRDEVSKFIPKNSLTQEAQNSRQAADGTQGKPGSRGPRGDTGEKGERGYPGIKGSKGERGYEGPHGPPGTNGQDGMPGYIGKIGTPGPSGPRGEPGPPGLRVNDGSWFSNQAHNLQTKQITTTPPLKGEKGEPGVTTIFHHTSHNKHGVKNVRHDERRKTSVNSKLWGNEPSGQQSSSMVVVDSLADLTLQSFPLGSLAFIKSMDSLIFKGLHSWNVLEKGPSVMEIGPIENDNQLSILWKSQLSGIVPKDSRVKAQLGNQNPNTFTQDQELSRKPSKLRLIALNSPRSGDIHGVLGLDYQCYREAREAQLQGTFRGFLASGSRTKSGHLLQSIVRVQDRDLPVVNLKGEELFADWNQIYEEKGKMNPKTPIYSFNGADVLNNSMWPRKLSWHGGGSWGESSNYHCQGWSTGSSLEVGMASDLGQGMVLDQQKVPCDYQLILLCIETSSHTLFST